MNDKALLDTVNDALNEAELRSDEIPAIDLYVDQILNLINDKLGEGSERYRDRVLTKTMINNYSKDGIITPVKGKKYNKEQIVQMLTVYTLKGTLSINEIKRTLKGAYASGDFDGEDLTALYDRYLDIKNDNREYAKMALDGIIERNGLDMESDVDYISAICALVAFSAQLKNIAQAMIDDRFPDANASVESSDEAKAISPEKIEKIERKIEKIERRGERKAERKVEKVEKKTERKIEKKREKIKAKENSGE
jgi:hypothetical protein